MYKLACRNLHLAGFFACVASLATTAGNLGLAVVSPNATQHAVEVILPIVSDPDALVNIPDAVLRRAVEEELGKGEDENISRRDMADLSTLSVSGDVGRLAGLEHAVNLVDFYCYCVLDGNDISDLTPLASLDVLTTLYMWGCGVSDVTPLSELRSLRTLVLGRNDITDVTPLAGLNDLEYLNFSLNAVFDLSAVNGLRSLKGLNAYTNYISDITPLESLDTLTDLNLQRNGISDIKVLSGLSMLSNLNLKENHIIDVDPLIENESLGVGAVVDLRYNPLSLNALETGIPLLQEKGVDVRFDAPESSTDIEIVDPELRAVIERATRRGNGWPIGMDDMESVFVLDARGFHVEDLQGLGHATRLSYVDLSGSSVSDISPLDDLAFLRILYLDGNEVSDLAPLAGLPLWALSLRDTKVTDFGPLANIDSLRWLALDGNSISELPRLPRGLQILHLTNNAVADIGELANLRSLREVRLSGNSIRSLAPLGGLSNLAYVFLNDNDVGDLAPLNLESVVELHLRNNRVRNIGPLREGSLAVVDVRGNALAERSVNVHVPALREEGTTVLVGHAVPYFPAVGGSNEGFVRLVNKGNASGSVFIEAVDDAGVRFGPERLRLGARRAVHFDSSELQDGHAAKGFAGIGPPTVGDWRLEIASALDIEVLSYVRAEDGLVTPVHDIGQEGEGSGGLPSFGVFDSAGGGGSILRVVNTEAGRARWTTGGYDDRGSWRAMTNAFVLPGGSALTFTAEQLRDDHGLGEGGRHMRVRGFPWFAQNLYMSPTGHLANLSTTPTNGAEPLADGTTRHRVPFLPAAAGPYEGLVRVVNRSAHAGQATIDATDDEGNRFGPARLSLDARQAVLFSSADLEHGNDAKGLAGAVGPGEGDWRLTLTSALDLQVLSYVRSEGGLVSAMHDLAPVAADGSHRVVYFNPASNRRHVSKLRLANDGEQTAAVTITGIDDRGAQSGTVTLTVPAMSAATFTSAQLESGGAGLAGSLGDGYGKWRLRVESDVPLAVMSLAESRDGHLVNVSTGTAD